MSFDFDPFEQGLPSLPGLERSDTHDGAGDRGPQRVVIRIDYDLCDDTAACAMVCPEEVIDRIDGHSRVINPEACTECWLCVENCPTGAVEIS